MSPKRFNPFDWVSWYALGYRTLMKVAHRYGWHHTGKPLGPFEDGSTQLWCRWCGLRQTTPPDVITFTSEQIDLPKEARDVLYKNIRQFYRRSPRQIGVDHAERS